MIADHDRSGWFGASDTATIMGNWETPTFKRWWLVKLGLTQNNYTSLAMMAGTAYEHRILDKLGIRQRDRQIKLRWLRLRVNLDGEDRTTVHEVKTHNGAGFKVSAAYFMQCQVEMLATGKQCVIDAYRLTEEEYSNYFMEIDPERLTRHPIEYDRDWVENEYLPRLWYLARCLKERRVPGECDRKSFESGLGYRCRRLVFEALSKTGTGRKRG